MADPDLLQDYWRVTDPDDPGFEVQILARAGFVSVGRWRPDAANQATGAITVLPKFFSATWDKPPAPLCELAFKTEADGHVVCYSFTVNARPDDRTRPEVTLAGVRNIRIGELKRRATQLALTEGRMTENGASLRHPAKGDQIDVSDVVAELEQKAHQPHRGKKLSDAHLRKVADVYREALKAKPPLPPTKAVLKHFHTARPNAGRWVALARKRGFLEEAEAPRRAGEKRKPTRRKKGGQNRGKR
jgi:hypothetical protein